MPTGWWEPSQLKGCASDFLELHVALMGSVTESHAIPTGKANCDRLSDGRRETY
jgi:hypothetical protein